MRLNIDHKAKTVTATPDGSDKTMVGINRLVELQAEGYTVIFPYVETSDRALRHRMMRSLGIEPRKEIVVDSNAMKDE
jgi:hypothetical protein